MRIKRKHIRNATVGVVGAAGAYYAFAQTDRPNNSHPETLTRQYLTTSFELTDKACPVGHMDTMQMKRPCAIEIFDTTSRLFIHWRNAMTQNLYNSTYGTIIGDLTVTNAVAKLDTVCRFPARVVASIKDQDKQIEAASEYARDCAAAIRNQIPLVQKARKDDEFSSYILGPVHHELKDEDFVNLERLRSRLAIPGMR